MLEARVSRNEGGRAVGGKAALTHVFLGGAPVPKQIPGTLKFRGRGFVGIEENAKTTGERKKSGRGHGS